MPTASGSSGRRRAARRGPIRTAPPQPLPPLRQRREAAGASPPQRVLPGAERRHLTVMFCDLADFDAAFGAARSRRHGRRDPRLSGGWSARPSGASTATSPSSWATACSSISVTRTPRKRTPSARFAAALAILDAVPALDAEIARDNGPASPCASASRAGSSSSARRSARARRASRPSSARRPTSPLACRPSPAPTPF